MPPEWQRGLPRLVGRAGVRARAAPQQPVDNLALPGVDRRHEYWGCRTTSGSAAAICSSASMSPIRA